MASKSMLVKLPPALGNYVYVFTPRAPGKNAKDKEKVYDITLAWPRAEAEKLVVQEVLHNEDGSLKLVSKPLAQAIREVAEAAWPGKGEEVIRKMKDPVLREGDEEKGLGGMYVMHAKRKESFGPPFLYDSRRRPIVTEEQRDRKAAEGFDLNKLNPGKADDEAYSGCTFVAQVTLYANDHPEGGKGVRVGLAGAQVTRKGPRIGGVRVDPDAFDDVPDEPEQSAPAGGKRDPWA